jgi:hypothetical protein
MQDSPLQPSCSFLNLDESQELDIHIREVQELLSDVKKPMPPELKLFESDLQAVSVKLHIGLSTQDIYCLLSKIEALVKDSVWVGMMRVQPTPGVASKVRNVLERLDELGYYLNSRYRDPEVKVDNKYGEPNVLVRWRKADQETLTSARVTYSRRMASNWWPSRIKNNAAQCTEVHMRNSKLSQDQLRHSLRSLSAQCWFRQGTQSQSEDEAARTSSNVALTIVESTIGDLLKSALFFQPDGDLVMFAQEGLGDGSTSECKHVLRTTESASQIIAGCLKYELLPAIAQIYTTPTHWHRPIILQELDKWQPQTQMEEAIQRLASYESGRPYSSWNDFEALKLLADGLMGWRPSNFRSGSVWVSLRALLGRQVKESKLTERHSKAIQKTISSALSMISEIVPPWSTPGGSVQMVSDNADFRSNDSSKFSRLSESCTIATTDDSRVPISLMDKIQGAWEVTTLAPSSGSSNKRGLTTAELCSTDDERFVLNVH